MEEEIKKRAYEIYIRRTLSPMWYWGQLGTKDGDWAQAEKEIKEERCGQKIS